jgi:hypothetical protein
MHSTRKKLLESQENADFSPIDGPGPSKGLPSQVGPNKIH